MLAAPIKGIVRLMEESVMYSKPIKFIAATWFVLFLGCLMATPIGAGDKAEAKGERPAWTKTLTEAQRKQIEHQHHELDDAQAPYKEKEAQTLAELNAMTVREDADLAAIRAKIDELMEAKTQIMRLRYEHLVEMRSVLTDEQKVGYDQGVLKRSAVR